MSMAEQAQQTSFDFRGSEFEVKIENYYLQSFRSSNPHSPRTAAQQKIVPQKQLPKKVSDENSVLKFVKSPARIQSAQPKLQLQKMMRQRIVQQKHNKIPNSPLQATQLAVQSGFTNLIIDSGMCCLSERTADGQKEAYTYANTPATPSYPIFPKERSPKGRQKSRKSRKNPITQTVQQKDFSFHKVPNVKVFDRDTSFGAIAANREGGSDLTRDDIQLQTFSFAGISDKDLRGSRLGSKLSNQNWRRKPSKLTKGEQSPKNDPAQPQRISVCSVEFQGDRDKIKERESIVGRFQSILDVASSNQLQKQVMASPLTSLKARQFQNLSGYQAFQLRHQRNQILSKNQGKKIVGNHSIQVHDQLTTKPARKLSQTMTPYQAMKQNNPMSTAKLLSTKPLIQGVTKRIQSAKQSQVFSGSGLISPHYQQETENHMRNQTLSRTLLFQNRDQNVTQSPLAITSAEIVSAVTNRQIYRNKKVSAQTIDTYSPIAKSGERKKKYIRRQMSRGKVDKIFKDYQEQQLLQPSNNGLTIECLDEIDVYSEQKRKAIVLTKPNNRYNGESPLLENFENHQSVVGDIYANESDEFNTSIENAEFLLKL